MDSVVGTSKGGKIRLEAGDDGRRICRGSKEGYLEEHFVFGCVAATIQA